MPHSYRPHLRQAKAPYGRPAGLAIDLTGFPGGLGPVVRQALLVFSLCLFCVTSLVCGSRDRPGQAPAWSARALDGSPVDLNATPGPLVLNVYSPTCFPCIQELPALERLYRESQRLGGSMYLVVENDPLAAGLEPDYYGDPDERSEQVRDRLRIDIERFGIEIPVLILGDEFRVGREGSLVTATPETLFFSGSPKRLHYNFVGPLSVREDPAGLTDDTRLQFALRLIDRLAIDDSGDGT